MISIIFLTKNSEKDIKDAIKSAKGLAGEVIVIDDNSEDQTRNISKEEGAKVFVHSLDQDFAQQRNFGKTKAKGDWIFYVDFDERITPELEQEIINLTDSPSFNAYAVPRKNIILGKTMIHGGWYPDYVERLFKKDKLKRWKNKLHERPEFIGDLGYLENPLLHYKHDNLEDMVEKTNAWSQTEAKLMLDSNHPAMVPWRFIRIMLTELYLRLIKLKGLQDGSEGVIYSIYQMWSRFISYTKLWEMQKEGNK
jgi:glycosyltransferase involved in cell wall biosynthesis